MKSIILFFIGIRLTDAKSLIFVHDYYPRVSYMIEFKLLSFLIYKFLLFSIILYIFCVQSDFKLVISVFHTNLFSFKR